MAEAVFNDFHLFGGSGGGALGFSWAQRSLGPVSGRFRCIGSVDVSANRTRDFSRLLATPGTSLDLFDEESYLAFHAKYDRQGNLVKAATMPKGWRGAVAEDLRRAACYLRPNVIFLSAPCLPADGRVLTPNGAVAISTLNTGDLVLTHRGRYRPIRAIGRHDYTGTMYGLRLNGSVDVQWFTDEHPIWARRVIRNAATGRRRLLGPASFLPAKGLRTGDRIGFPVDREVAGTARSFCAAVGNPQVVEKGGASEGRYAKPRHEAVLPRIVDLTPHVESADLWFLFGAYLGDGYRLPDGEVAFCVGAADGDLFTQVTSRLDTLRLTWNVDRNGGDSNVKVRTHSRHLWLLCGRFGDGAAKKDLPPEIFGLERRLVEALVAGYRATDGSEQGPQVRRPARNNLLARWRVASVSLALLCSVQRLLLRLGIYGFINETWPGGPQVIMGREVQTRPRWELTVRLDAKKRATYEFADGAVWVRLRSIEKRETDEPVWNLDVDEDDTFCAPMMATHNCKGFSGLLSGALAGSPKYQALNRLTVRGIRLALEAWKDDPPEFVVFENVPRIAQRGAALVEEIVALLMKYGYAVHRDAHDCGELGGLAQHRKRFLLLARHVGKVRPFVYQPPKLRVRAIGEVIGPLPMPEDPAGGPMHRLPRLKLQTLLRLALIPAGKDWRALNDVDVSRLRLMPAAAIRKGGASYNNVFRVVHWNEPSPAVTGGAGPSSGGLNVADPRPSTDWAGTGKYKVTPAGDPAGTVIAESSTGNGAFAFADTRLSEAFGEHGTKMQVDPVDRPARTVTGARVGSGAQVIADVRVDEKRNGALGVKAAGEPAGAVCGESLPSNGAFAFADPRPAGADWRPGVMGVQSFDEPSATVTSRAGPTNGAYTVADPRPIDGVKLEGGYTAKSVTLRVKSMDEPAPTVAASSSVWDSAGFALEDVRLPSATPRNGTMKVQDWHRPGDTVTAAGDVWAGSSAVADVRAEPRDGDLVVIFSEDGTWHRPLTAWELAALQSMPLFIDGEPLVLSGSPTEWREAIGNMVPPLSAKAIAEVLLDSLLEEAAGVTFKLTSGGVWVSPDDPVGRELGWMAA